MSSPGGRRDITFLFGQFVPRCTHRIDKRFDGYYVLQYMHGGGVELNVDDKTSAMEGRWFWSSYPGPRIAFKPLAPHKTWVHRYLAFKGPAVSRWMDEGLFPVPPMPCPADAPGRDWAERFDVLLELSRRDDPWGRKRAALKLESLLCELAESRSVPSNEPDWISTAKSRLVELGLTTVDYDALAQQLGMSPRTFRREFARRVGVPPHRYLLSSRISHAREMLAHTDLPIKQIARELGYGDVFYFTRQFRRLVGVPPGVYRRSREG